ncbi:MAG: histidine phosphatase family protein [Ruminococcaceae bacterium]|nr:histidine phosphatase family protein [Oscillospiraceae bacterium]
MTTILLVRHGQSAANLTNRFAGHSHFPLTELGFVQAEKTADYITSNYKIDKLYSSDLLRAYNTACPISTKLGMCPIITEVGLREIYAGKWEGHNIDELPALFPEQRAVWAENIAECRIEGGETVREMAERSRKAILRIAAENDGKTVAMTSHATVVRAFETFARYGSVDRMSEVPWPTNASVNLYSYENGKISPLGYSIDEHLGEYRQKIIMENGTK